jgi:hypothetical protein
VAHAVSELPGCCRTEGKGSGGGFSLPSSFFSTLSTAPEQPLQDMLTLNLYVCSASAILDSVRSGRLRESGMSRCRDVWR